MLSLINLDQKDTNGNLFRLTAGACPEMDGVCEVIGQVVDEASLKVIRAVSGMEVNADFRPKHPVVVKQCGEM